MKIEDEITKLGSLERLGLALVEFSRSLFPGEFKKKSNAWIYGPNFVGFEVRHARVQRLNILVRPTVQSVAIQKYSAWVRALGLMGEELFLVRGNFRQHVHTLKRVGATGIAILSVRSRSFE